MGILKKIIHILANICYVGIIIYLLLLLPRIFGNKPIVVLTGSMEPKYKVGTLIYYKKVKQENIKVGDVIAFDNGNDEIVTHRVSDIKDDLFETKGDANEVVDASLVDYKSIKGKVTKLKIPLVGHLIYFINKHLYLVGLIVIILILEFVLSNFDIKFGKKQENKYE